PSGLEVCFFVNSGGEANDLALRLARCHTKAQDIISVAWGYHGATTADLEVSPYKLDGRGGFKPPPYCHKVPRLHLCNTIQYNTIQYNTIQYNTIQFHKPNININTKINKCK